MRTPDKRGEPWRVRASEALLRSPGPGAPGRRPACRHPPPGDGSPAPHGHRPLDEPEGPWLIGLVSGGARPAGGWPGSRCCPAPAPRAGRRSMLPTTSRPVGNPACTAGMSPSCASQFGRARPLRIRRLPSRQTPRAGLHLPAHAYCIDARPGPTFYGVPGGILPNRCNTPAWALSHSHTPHRPQHLSVLGAIGRRHRTLADTLTLSAGISQLWPRRSRPTPGEDSVCPLFFYRW